MAEAVTATPWPWGNTKWTVEILALTSFNCWGSRTLRKRRVIELAPISISLYSSETAQASWKKECSGIPLLKHLRIQRHKSPSITSKFIHLYLEKYWPWRFYLWSFLIPLFLCMPYGSLAPVWVLLFESISFSHWVIAQFVATGSANANSFSSI